MRVYDLALAVVRTLVGMDFIRGGLDILYTGVRFIYLIGSARESIWLSKVELSTWLSPIFSLASAGVLLWTSPRIARFAAKFASSDDTATHFR